MPTLILLVLGLLAVWGTARLLRGETDRTGGGTERTGGETERSGSRAPSLAIGFIAAGLICGQVLSGGIGAASTVLHPVPAETVRTDGQDTQGGTSAGINEGAMAAIDAALPKDAKIIVACPAGCTEITPAWILTRLAPRVPVRDPLRADWMVFAGIAPTDPTFAALAFDQTRQIDDKTWIAHVIGPAA